MKNKLISRQYNQITLQNGFVQKTSANLQKLDAEFRWLDEMKRNIFIPSVNKIDDGYEIRFIDSNNLGEVFWKLPFLEKRALINIYIDFISTNRRSLTGNMTTMNKYLLVEKFETRVGGINNIEPLREIYLNKMNSLLPKLEKNFFGIMHGDLFFGNTLYGNRQLYFIDPRGFDEKNGIYGSIYYDLIKLTHSIHGLYDNIIFDSSCRKHYKKINKYFFKQVLNNFDLTKDELLLGEMGLFLSMIPLHSDSTSRQMKFLATAKKIAKEIKWEKL